MAQDKHETDETKAVADAANLPTETIELVDAALPDEEELPAGEAMPVPANLQSSDEAEKTPRFNGDHVFAIDDPEQRIGFFKHAGGGHGTIRYPDGEMIGFPISRMRLSDHPLTSLVNDNDETDFVPGDLVYDVNDSQRIVGRFSSDRWTMARIEYPGNRTEQVELGDIRAAIFTDDDMFEPDDLDVILAQRPQQFGSFIRGMFDDSDDDDDLFITANDLAADEALTDADLQQLTRPPTGEDLKPGDVLFAPTGEYRVNYVIDGTVSLRHRINGAEISISIKTDDLAKLLQAKGYEEQIDPIDSIDVDPIIPSLQQQLAEATTENNRLRDEIVELRAAAAANDEANAAMKRAERHIDSLTVVFSDVERQTGDKRIAGLIAAGWWLVPQSETFLVRTNAKGSQVIDHAMRFEYTASGGGNRTEQALAALDEPEDLPLVDDATESEPALVHALETSSS